MDAFKTAEVQRMSLGGNKPFKDFFNSHTSNSMMGRSFDDCTISERYDSEAGEEWKERLTCKVEGREYVPGATKRESVSKKKEVGELPGSTAGSGRNTPNRSGMASPPPGAGASSQKERNEAYFASLGNANASRPDNLAPSQGGKYSGFGSSPAPAAQSSNAPGVDDFQKDPMAALTKGFGWLSSTVSKQASQVNKTYLQPGMQNFASSDLAGQIRSAGMNLGNNVQTGARGLNEQFSKFVDPEHAQQGRREPEKKDFWDSFGQDPNGPPKEKKDFWDDFSAVGEQRAQATQQKPKASVGTSAMKSGGSGGGSGSGSVPKEEKEGWGDW